MVVAIVKKDFRLLANGLSRVAGERVSDIEVGSPAIWEQFLAEGVIELAAVEQPADRSALAIMRRKDRAIP